MWVSQNTIVIDALTQNIKGRKSLFTFRSRPRAPEFLRKGARESRRSRSKAVRTVREEVEDDDEM